MLQAYGLGIGKGISVLGMCDLFEKVTDKKVNRIIGPRRPHNVDVDTLYCDSTLAQKELNWKPKCTPEQMCKSATDGLGQVRTIAWLSFAFYSNLELTQTRPCFYETNFIAKMLVHKSRLLWTPQRLSKN